MHKIAILLGFLILTIQYAFSDTPAFMIETNTGYAIGVNLDNAYQFDVRLYYPIFNYGVALEAGGLFIQNDKQFHFFIAPMYFIVNSEKWRVPVAVGFDFMGRVKDNYYGIGGFAAVHYSFTKNIYVGFNLGISYAFDNKYDEIVGERDERKIEYNPDGTVTWTWVKVPIIENKSHFGDYIYFKPSIVIGIQF